MRSFSPVGRVKIRQLPTVQWDHSTHHIFLFKYRFHTASLPKSDSVDASLITSYLSYGRSRECPTSEAFTFSSPFWFSAKIYSALKQMHFKAIILNGRGHEDCFLGSVHRALFQAGIVIIPACLSITKRSFSSTSVYK